MAIEVIKRGNPPSEAIYDRTCDSCHSQLRFRRGDARMSYDQRDGDAVVIDCPVCGKQVWTAVGLTSVA